MKRAFGVRDLDQFTSRLAELRLELPVPLSPGEFVAHTDGACLGNPEGPGGWAAVVEPGPDGVPWLYFPEDMARPVEPEQVGVLVADAVLSRRFAVFTHPEDEERFRTWRHDIDASLAAAVEGSPPPPVLS